jgi:transposase
VVLTRRLKRRAVEPFFAHLAPALIGIEACGSAHYWARVLTALGHEVRLIPAVYVKPFVRRNKTAARDAAAICEAVRRPSMRFVRIKTEEQQAARGLENARDMLVRQRTQLMNGVRGMLAELGIVAATGLRGFKQLVARIEAAESSIPPVLLPALAGLLRQWRAAGEEIAALETRLVARAREDETMCRLTTIPGVGALTAHAIVAAIGDGQQFRSARDFAAWVGLTPRMHASGNRRRDATISRQGDSGLRRLLVLGAAALVRYAKMRPPQDAATGWIHGLLARRPVKVAIIAQAAKIARTAWAVLTSGKTYRGNRAPA